MTVTDEQRDRWMAYLLGDARPEERDAIEAEMDSHPKEAAEVRRAYELAVEWAKAPAPEASRVFMPEEFSPRPSQGRSPWVWPVAAAAAAMLLLAFAQVSFSVELGDFSFAWGPEDAIDTAAPAVEDRDFALRLNTLEQNNDKLREQVEAVALQSVLIERDFEVRTAELAYSQFLETQARYIDMEDIVRLASISEASTQR